MFILFCALAVTLQCLSAVVVAVQPLKILSIVSNSSGVDTPLWGRGEELIPGALLAAQQVNTNEDVLNGFHIEVVPLFVQDCSVSEGILKTVQELLSTDTPVIGVTGLFCPTLVETLSPLLSSREISLTQLSAAPFIDRVLEYKSSRVHNIVPGIQTKLDAMFDLMKALDWNRFNTVTVRPTTPLEDLYTKVIEMISNSKMKHSELQLDNSVENVIRLLKQSTARIVVAALPPETAADLLCHAYKNKMIWPRYGWIMLDLTVSESAQCGGESLLRAMENVIVLKSKFEQSKLNTIRSNQYFRSSGFPFNPYTNVLYDSVWALALAVNSSLQTLHNNNLTLTAKTVFGTLSGEATQTIEYSLSKTSFNGASGEFKNGQIQVSQEIFQIQNKSFILFGEKHLQDNTTFQLDLLDEMRPQDDIPQIYEFIPLTVTVIMSVGIGLCIVFVTAMLILFFCYWRQPEVRASSRALSLCIFLGCYLLLNSALCTSVSWGIPVEPGVPVCVISVYGCIIGVDLILATVLAKALRIAYVFNKFKKIGKFCSDIALLAMITVIVSGKLILLAIWYTIDRHHLVDHPEVSTDDDGLLYYMVFQECSSQYLEVWLLLVLAYTTSIGMALVILAYRTRKIKRGHFKDTKKINGFFVSLIAIGFICIPLWVIFYLVEMYQASTYVATIGYTAVPIACQVFLIVPKVWPGLKKSFFLQDRLRSKNLSLTIKI